MTARTTTVQQPGARFSQPQDWIQVSSWAQRYVYTMFREGWMVGDQNGNFRPTANISRAEVATTINRTLRRIDGREMLAGVYLANGYAVRNFPDVQETSWYFPSVVAASSDHRIRRNEYGEIIWKEILPMR